MFITASYRVQNQSSGAALSLMVSRALFKFWYHDIAVAAESSVIIMWQRELVPHIYVYFIAMKLLIIKDYTIILILQVSIQYVVEAVWTLKIRNLLNLQQYGSFKCWLQI